MKAVVLMATPYPKSLHGKGEKWIAQHVARPDDSVKHSQPRSQHALAAWRQWISSWERSRGCGFRYREGGEPRAEHSN